MPYLAPVVDFQDKSGYETSNQAQVAAGLQATTSESTAARGAIHQSQKTELTCIGAENAGVIQWGAIEINTPRRDLAHRVLRPGRSRGVFISIACHCTRRGG